MKRVLTALVLAPCVLGLILLAPPAVFGAAVAALAVGGLREFYALAQCRGMRALAAPGYAAGALLTLLPDLTPLPGADSGPLLAALALALLAAAGFRQYGGLKKSLPAAALTLAGAAYVAAPLLCGRLLHREDPHLLVFVLVVNAAGDIAALYIGKALGKRPLAPRVSPNKTWAGAVGSIVGSTLAGCAYAHVFLSDWLSPAAAAAAALALNAAGQMGDLAESALKRGAGVKDSGKLLPGHGGILDRLDAFLFAAPVMYVYWRCMRGF